MKELTEEQIQQLLETNKIADTESLLRTSEDARLYALVFEELKKEPLLQLSAHFSDKVAQKVFKAENKYTFSVHAYLLLTASIVLAFLISIVAIYVTNANLLINWFTALLEFRWIILFGLAVLLLVELGDKLLVRRKLNLHTNE